MAFTRKKGYEHINHIIAMNNEGINIDPAMFAELDLENTYLEQIKHIFDWNFKDYKESKIPHSFRLATTDFQNEILWNPSSRYRIEKENDKFYLILDKDQVIDEIYFIKKPAFYNQILSCGKKLSQIVELRADRGRVGVIYSNECALMEKNLDCLFCNINATKRRFGELEGIEWKNPKDIAEAVAIAYTGNYRGFNLTGGFVPERRELEYYFDVIDAVKDAVGTDDVHGMACIGAPLDLSVIEKYKEAGYQHVATNLEIWDENIFKTICPGKESLCGGHKNWIATLEKEVEVFGRGNVRSALIAGLEPKDSLLKGIEYLAEVGVMAYPTVWRPGIGSGLEGHRSPESSWYQEVTERAYNIHKKNGFTLENNYYVNSDDSVFAYYYKMDGQALPWEEKLDLID